MTGPETITAALNGGSLVALVTAVRWWANRTIAERDKLSVEVARLQELRVEEAKGYAKGAFEFAEKLQAIIRQARDVEGNQ